MDDSSDRRTSDSAPGLLSPGSPPFASTTFPAVILAAGKGARMKSRKPKALHPVCGKPMLRIITETAETAGLGPFVIVVSGESDAIREALGSGCLYAVQKERLGTGHALAQAQSVVPDCDNIVVMAGDTPSSDRAPWSNSPRRTSPRKRRSPCSLPVWPILMDWAAS